MACELRLVFRFLKGRDGVEGREGGSIGGGGEGERGSNSNWPKLKTFIICLAFAEKVCQPLG